MIRLLEIVVASSCGLSLYLTLRLILVPKDNRLIRAWVKSKVWFHPNAICIERAFISLIGLLIYFGANFQFAGIFLFTIGAFLDAVDGLVARSCGLITKLGEELDPLCDKLTYLPALWLFAYEGFLSVGIISALTLAELIGQFGVRWYLRVHNLSSAATNMGKWKAVLCFTLVIYCALLDGGLAIPDWSGAISLLCLGGAILSPLCKLPQFSSKVDLVLRRRAEQES